jgi:hypothetical protein
MRFPDLTEGRSLWMGGRARKGRCDEFHEPTLVHIKIYRPVCRFCTTVGMRDELRYNRGQERFGGKGMKERVVSFLCGLCLVLCFGVVVSWARSTVSSEGIQVFRRYSRFSLAASEGALICVRGELVFDNNEIEHAWRSAIDPDGTVDWGRWRVTWARDLGSIGLPNGSTFGFGYERTISDATRRAMMPGVRWHRTILQIPHWALVLLTGLMPGWWLYRRTRVARERAAKGLCRKCGFELGNVYHSCPKCGERAPLPDGFPVIEG